VARAIDCGHGSLRAVAMFQRQLRSLEPLTFRLWPPPDHSARFGEVHEKISDAGVAILGLPQERSRAAAWRRASRSRHGSGFDGVGFGMVRRVPVVLDCGEARLGAHRDRDGDGRLFAAFPDEGSACGPRTLCARRMDCLWRLARSGVRPACPELKCQSDPESFRNDEGEGSFRSRAEFECERTLVYTFEGGSLRRR